ncbi:hypothetical protein H5119_06500 [Pseudoalteromonas sp. SG45-5]|uniref:hypothetical protein n=1 Tax=unclassified Pseudoalteromonas TaxID=194690 RepID=UPI0015FCF443|nr:MULTISPECIES: hypothetical protein [unclassified Pseudoalteromonas]MBB1385199.1 hypothetical protein [Pseudoalteromonas sp. SG45-5]MBB1393177.1 hypothetical protein [Pseudoalteromonas sp. SG44-4]MBB1445573.1 hypothetical protein [Pseudoalteromonas sp. SG41-6]
MITNNFFKATLLSCAVLFCCASNAQVKGLLQIRAVQGDNVLSWQEGGIGLYRHDTQSDELTLSQGILDFSVDLASSWSAHGVLNANQDPDVGLGFTQAYVKYQPLSNSDYKWHVRVGGFYPLMSLENPDIGWTSPYNYTNSAINSWIGEEVRTVGAEVTIKRPAKRFNSAHSFSVVGATFKGNDPAGTLLSWRGFALHDRQTTFNESIKFAPITALNAYELRWQANQVLPFEEVDGRFGYYVGMHWDYLKQSQFRVYYYDNNGDPTKVNISSGQYAWDTRFVSAAWLYKFSKKTRLIAQILNGKTAMGGNLLINNAFYSHYVMLSHKENKHRVSLRYDYFKVTDNDTTAFDPNASYGEGLTATWRYDLSKKIQLGIEASALKSFAANRAAINFNERISQQQVMLNAQWRF